MYLWVQKWVISPQRMTHYQVGESSGTIVDSYLELSTGSLKILRRVIVTRRLLRQFNSSLTYSIVTVTKVTLVTDLRCREVSRHIYTNKVTYYNIDRSLDATYYLTVSAVWLMLVIPYRLVGTPWVRSSTFPSSTLIGTSPRQRHLSADMLISPHLVPIRFTTRSDNFVTVLGFNLNN